MRMISVFTMSTSDGGSSRHTASIFDVGLSIKYKALRITSSDYIGVSSSRTRDIFDRSRGVPGDGRLVPDINFYPENFFLQLVVS